MGGEMDGCQCLEVNEGWDWGLIPQLQIWLQFAEVKEGVGNLPLILHSDGILTADWWNEKATTDAALVLTGSNMERNTSHPVYATAKICQNISTDSSNLKT